MYTSVDHNVTSRLNICKMARKTKLREKKDPSRFSSFNIIITLFENQ